MITILSMLTAVKDYIEIVHKLVETNSVSGLPVQGYDDLGSIVSFFVLAAKDALTGFLTFKWLREIGSLPFLVPDVASAMLSEISVLDGYLHNAFTFFETRVSYGDQNLVFYGLEKFTIGLINSVFLCLPTSTAHVITLRRFVMQGIEAGYLAGLGTLAGNVVWIGSIVLGFRFIVIPWLSFDVFRYGFGFLILIKYMWDSYNERRNVVEDLSKRKIFLLNFLLAFTEQATVYPFLSNLSLGSDATLLESFPTGSFFEYSLVHLCYLGGLIVGGLSLLQLTCWFWENPAFNLYMWTLSSLKSTSLFSQKTLNLGFLYLTMFFAVSNLSYFGLDYTVTHPLGFVYEDRLVDQKSVLETSFLNTKASDRNTRRNRGRHGRRERWKRRVRRYRTFDVSLYDQGVYDLFTIEDLNYGFDRFWLRRKIRNHRVRFRFFPGPWMRSFKKQLARPRLESFVGPRVEFFRILFEQAYHPEFHEFQKAKTSNENRPPKTAGDQSSSVSLLTNLRTNRALSFYSERSRKTQAENLLHENSALRKFVRKTTTRTNSAQILTDVDRKTNVGNKNIATANDQRIYSKRWKQIFSKLSHDVGPSPARTNKFFFNPLERFYARNVSDQKRRQPVESYFGRSGLIASRDSGSAVRNEKQKSELALSKKDRQLLRYRTFLNATESEKTSAKKSALETDRPLTLVHPIKFYLQKEQAFRNKLRFYGATLFRNFGIENNAPYYRIMMKKFFYYYKPTLRWERTLRTATMRKARRKGPRVPKKLNVTKKTQMLAELGDRVDTDSNIRSEINGVVSSANDRFETDIQKPTHFYSLVGKRATRYRYQIYKDVLQHWYYSPFNRLLLKLDVDAFIRRQPKSHFLTKKEEKMLHLKRHLIADYYNTLRWYAYMQHYDTMKQNIGKTKSFASLAYDQQFFGTFKKIRHLFAITPTLSEANVLKFDQPLFNEYRSNEATNARNPSLYAAANIHEELMADEGLYDSRNPTQTFPDGLADQSLSVLKEYLKRTTVVRKDYIEKLLDQENYSELTGFLLKGQKVRGTRPTTNESSFLEQEKNYLLTTNHNERDALDSFFAKKLAQGSTDRFDVSRDAVWLGLIKKCQKTLYDQEALKRYVSMRVDKLEKQKRREEKAFRARLETMRRWVSATDEKNSPSVKTGQLSGLTSSLQKAIKEGMHHELFGAGSGLDAEKSNLRNNRTKILRVLPNVSRNGSKQRSDSNVSFKLKEHLNERLKARAFRAIDAERRLKTTFSSIESLRRKNRSVALLEQVHPTSFEKIFQRAVLPFKQVSRRVRSIAESDEAARAVRPFVRTFRFFVGERDKTLNDWKRKEVVLSTRKKIRRKIYRVLDQKKPVEKRLQPDALKDLNVRLKDRTVRQKADDLDSKEIGRRRRSWSVYENAKSGSNLDNQSPSKKTADLRRGLSSKTFSGLFDKNFKRKRSRGRRYRRFKGRGPIKKHTLAQKLKRQFKLLKRYGENKEVQDKKTEVFQMITKKAYDPQNSFELRETKERRTRQSKHRYWKKHKRQKYLQLKRKQRKRRRYTVSKMRVLSKQFKRARDQRALKEWWWKRFLPNFMTTNDAHWAVEKTKQIKAELDGLPVSEILKRDRSDDRSVGGLLQVGNYDFKPLMLPETIRLTEELIDKGRLKPGSTSTGSRNLDSRDDRTRALAAEPFRSEAEKSEKTVIAALSKNLFDASKRVATEHLATIEEPKGLVNVNPSPFYAGWDENLRQFVVTNRLLSRKDAGYEIKVPETGRGLVSQSEETSGKLTFTKAPLVGMNAATTLYWQIPFTTYDPDQFFALGMDGFSPLAWRFFDFKHSKQTTKPVCIRNVYSTAKELVRHQSLLAYNLQLKVLNLESSGAFGKKQQSSKNELRKIQKRQKRVKKHPRSPIWFPSGPLSNQILPVHYIYVFYKRHRLPRDRYIGRRLRRSDDGKATFIKTNFTTLLDFTLRKRAKPIRKYHRKRPNQRNEETTLIVRRRPFRALMTEQVRFRPMAKSRLSNESNMLNSGLLKTTSRKKNLKTKPTSENLRIRQLRRRIQRQVLRPIWRYKPRSGGIVWPGDYLRLESVKAPVLKESTTRQTATQLVESSSPNGRSQARARKRRNLQEWQVQPKKYLIEKHNLRVFRKRLQKCGSSAQLSKKINELKLLI